MKKLILFLGGLLLCSVVLADDDIDLETLFNRTYNSTNDTIKVNITGSANDMDSISADYVTAGILYVGSGDYYFPTNAPADNEIMKYDSSLSRIVWEADAGGAGSPGGNSGDVQYNDDGSLQGSVTHRIVADTFRFYEGANYVALKRPPLTADTTYTLPILDGKTGYFLRTDGAGTLNWGAGGSGSPSGASGDIQYNANGSFGGSVTLKFGSNALRFYEGANYVGLTHPALTSDTTWKLPILDGATGYHLATDGSGNLYWDDDDAGGGGGGDTFRLFINFPPQSAKLTGTDLAGDAAIDAGKNHWEVLFDDTANESVMWQSPINSGYKGGSVTVDITCIPKANVAIGNVVAFQVAFMAMASPDAAVTVDASSYYHHTTVQRPTYSGIESGSIMRLKRTFTNASLDGLVAGDILKTVVTRDATGYDTNTSDVAIIGYCIQE